MEEVETYPWWHHDKLEGDRLPPPPLSSSSIHCTSDSTRCSIVTSQYFSFIMASDASVSLTERVSPRWIQVDALEDQIHADDLERRAAP